MKALILAFLLCLAGCSESDRQTVYYVHWTPSPPATHSCWRLERYPQIHSHKSVVSFVFADKTITLGSDWAIFEVEETRQ